MEPPSLDYGFVLCDKNDPNATQYWCPRYEMWFTSKGDSCQIDRGVIWRKPIDPGQGWELVPPHEKPTEGMECLTPSGWQTSLWHEHWKYSEVSVQEICSLTCDKPLAFRRVKESPEKEIDDAILRHRQASKDQIENEPLPNTGRAFGNTIRWAMAVLQSAFENPPNTPEIEEIEIVLSHYNFPSDVVKTIDKIKWLITHAINNDLEIQRLKDANKFLEKYIDKNSGVPL